MSEKERRLYLPGDMYYPWKIGSDIIKDVIEREEKRTTSPDGPVFVDGQVGPYHDCLRFERKEQ